MSVAGGARTCCSHQHCPCPPRSPASCTGRGWSASRGPRPPAAPGRWTACRPAGQPPGRPAHGGMAAGPGWVAACRSGLWLAAGRVAPDWCQLNCRLPRAPAHPLARALLQATARTRRNVWSPSSMRATPRTEVSAVAPSCGLSSSTKWAWSRSRLEAQRPSRSATTAALRQAARPASRLWCSSSRASSTSALCTAICSGDSWLWTRAAAVKSASTTTIAARESWRRHAVSRSC